MNQPTYEFNGYTFKGPNKGAFYKPVDSEQSLIVVKDSTIYAEIQFINDGLNVYAPQGTRTEGNTIIIL